MTESGDGVANADDCEANTPCSATLLGICLISAWLIVEENYGGLVVTAWEDKTSAMYPRPLQPGANGF